MPYVRRNAMGEIESVHRSLGSDATEYLDGTDAELMEFFNRAGVSIRDLPVDPNVVEVLDEVTSLMLAKGLIRLEELPLEAQAKWLFHKDRQAKARQQRFSASGFVEIIDDSAFGVLDGPTG